MGLDLMLVKVKKGVELTWDNYDKEATQLAYGRKSWEICRWFGATNDPDGIYKIEKSEWDKFKAELENIGDDLDAIWDAFYIYENLPDDFPEYALTENQKRLIAKYEVWYRRTFDGEYPTLGYFFSVGYMRSFYEAIPEVWSAYRDGDSIYLAVSY